MKNESYANSIRKVVLENNITTIHINNLKKLIFHHRKVNNLLTDDDYNCLKTREPHQKWEHRIHGGLQNLKREQEVIFLGDGNYKFVK